MKEDIHFETVRLRELERNGVLPGDSRSTPSPAWDLEAREVLEEARMGVRLRSWSEIAAFISSGVRTAQRYERELGLPVYREREGGEVWAEGDELLNWVRGFNAPNRLQGKKGLDDMAARTGGKKKK